LLSMIAGAREIIFNAPAFGDATFIIILFTALFVASDFKSGTIKNTAVCGAPRPQIYLSRLITVFAFGVGIILLCVISGTVLG
jgi:ABC-2 type transport system permease protein